MRSAPASGSMAASSAPPSPARVEAGIVHPGLVGLDGAQHDAERRAKDAHREVEDQDRDDGAEIVAVGEGELPAADIDLRALVHDDTEEMRRQRAAFTDQDLWVIGVDLQAGLTIGQRREHRIGEVERHLGESQCQDREVDA